MNKRTANKVLAEVKATFDTEEPTLYDAGHEGLPKGSFSIAWEGGAEDWTYEFRTAVPGVYVEAMNHWSLGVYDA